MEYATKIITPPSAEPVTLAEVKAHIRSNAGTAEDTVLTMLATAARQDFEHETGRYVLPTTAKQVQTCWEYPTRIIKGNVSAVATVKYFDADDQEQDLEGYTVDLDGTPALIYLPDDDWPVLSTKRPRPVAITYTAGWANAAAVPLDVKVAICELAAFLYEVRESHTEAKHTEKPAGFKRVCDKYKTGMEGF